MPKKKCHDVDGAYFGCSFSNILLMVNLSSYLRSTPISFPNLFKQPLFQKFTVSKYMVKKVQNIVKRKT